MKKEYRVTWEIQVDGKDYREAIEEAVKILRDQVDAEPCTATFRVIREKRIWYDSLDTKETW